MKIHKYQFKFEPGLILRYRVTTRKYFRYSFSLRSYNTFRVTKEFTSFNRSNVKRSIRNSSKLLYREYYSYWLEVLE